jgi:DNA-binding CsgD family transcriptional regulator
MIAEVEAGPAGQVQALACPLALARAQLGLARDEIDAARARLDEADRHAGGQLAGEPGAGVVSGLLRAQCAIAESDPAGARAQILRLRAATAADGATGADTALAGTGGAGTGWVGTAGAGAAGAGTADDQELGHALTMLEVDAALLAGERERAVLDLGRDPAANRPDGADGADGADQDADGADQDARSDVQLCRARLLLTGGDDKGALEAVEPCLDGSAAGTTRREKIAALLVAAVALRRLSQVADAAESIERALVLAEPDGAYRVFLDGGPAVRSAMTVLVPPTSRCAGFAGRVLERFDGQLPRPAQGPAPAELPLTSSELAVLRFLPSHMTNQEIAEALFLSINTVKTHLRSAYRKLGVANRRQAIARGRRLDLL